jgi:hypothetical protein
MKMRSLFNFLLASISALVVNKTLVAAGDGISTDRTRAGEILQKALQESNSSQIDATKQLEMLIEASNKATGVLGPNSAVARKLKSTLDQAGTLETKDAKQNMKMLRKKIDEVQKDLSFQPIKEAEQPKGFPTPTTVGEVEVKQYPAYRKAQTDMSPNRAFLILFSHIKKNDIGMTAPVEMGYDNLQADEPKEQKMAFLYGQPSLGNVGKDGYVDVVDVPAMTVVSTGVRGIQNTESLLDARHRLEAWLESNKGNWIADGPLRTMAYNSPFVRQDRNYFEVQIPIRKVEFQSRISP